MIREEKNKQIVAVFDFDKTITSKHTFIRFMRYISGNYKFYFSLIYLLPQIIRYKLGHISLMTLREKAIKRIFFGITEDFYKSSSQQFVEVYVNKWLSAEAIYRIVWHKTMGHRLILLSNSPEDYLRIWASQFGFDYVMGSRFEFVNGVATGKILGEHCFGKEKVKRLKDLLKCRDDYYVYGYGDSEGDLDFLNYSDEAYYRLFDLKKIYTNEEYRI